MQNSPLKETLEAQTAQIKAYQPEIRNKRESSALSVISEFFFGKIEPKKELVTEISEPQNFKHVSGFSHNKLFFDPNDSNMQTMLAHLLTHFNLDTNSVNKKLVIEFASSKGGIQKVSEQLAIEKHSGEQLQRPKAAPPPVPMRQEKLAVVVDKEIESQIAVEDCVIKETESEEIENRRNQLKKRNSCAVKRRSTVRKPLLSEVKKEAVIPPPPPLIPLEIKPQVNRMDKVKGENDLSLNEEKCESNSSGSFLDDIAKRNFQLRKRQDDAQAGKSAKPVPPPPPSRNYLLDKKKDEISTQDQNLNENVKRQTGAGNSDIKQASGSFLDDIAKRNIQLKKRQNNDQVDENAQPQPPRNNLSAENGCEELGVNKAANTDIQSGSFLGDIANSNFKLKKVVVNEKGESAPSVGQTMYNQFKEFLDERRRYFGQFFV